LDIFGHKKLENTDFYTQLLNFESDDWHVAHARNLEEENKLIEAGFEYVRYSEKESYHIPQTKVVARAIPKRQ
jgi:hypothetical protein